MGNNNGAFRYSNAHSNYTVRWQFKTEHSDFKAVVTRVTLPYFCDSCYQDRSVTFVTRVTMFRTLWFGVKWPDMCNIVTISSSTIRRRITTFNVGFQGFISVWRKIHIFMTRVTLPYQPMFEIIPWENKLDNILSLYYNIANKGINDRYWQDIGAVTNVLTTNSVCLMHLIIALKMEEFDFFTHCIKLTKNHTNAFSSSINVFPNTYKTVCVKAINLQWK